MKDAALSIVPIVPIVPGMPGMPGVRPIAAPESRLLGLRDRGAHA